MDLLEATLQLSRQVAEEPPILLSTLTRYTIDQRAATTIARHLSQLDGEALERLSTIVAKIPPAASIPVIIRSEQKLATQWIDQQIAQAEASPDVRAAMQKAAEGYLIIGPAEAPAAFKKEISESDARALLERLKSDFAEVATLAEQPTPENASTLEAFLKALRHEERNALLSKIALPIFSRAFIREEKAAFYRAALRAGIALKEKDAPLPTEVTDASSSRTFLCEKAEGGFDLKAKEPITSPGRDDRFLVLKFR